MDRFSQFAYWPSKL